MRFEQQVVRLTGLSLGVLQRPTAYLRRLICLTISNGLLHAAENLATVVESIPLFLELSLCGLVVADKTFEIL